MRIDRCERRWFIVDGRAPAFARWELVNGHVQLQSHSDRQYAVSRDDTPLSIAVALLALRDAEAFVQESPQEVLDSYVLRKWLAASRDPLVIGRSPTDERFSLWGIYRSTLLAAVGMRSSEVVVNPVVAGTNHRIW
jgi:hypothetical protein